MSVTTWEQVCSLRDILGRFPIKRVARAADAHPKTAARWRRGEAVPSGDAVMRMLANDDDLCAAILSAAGRASEAARARAAAHLERALAALGEAA